jgi:hypothetical protein
MEPKGYRDKYLIHGSAIPLADRPGFSAIAHVTYAEGSPELDWHAPLPETEFASIEEAEAAGAKYAAAHVDQEIERWKLTHNL